MDDLFYIPAKESRVEIKVKGSRFIGGIFYVDSVETAASAIEKIKKKEYSASHNCYAYRVGFKNQPDFKYSDDGEPSGTAGKPIYDVISGKNLVNCLAVVTRYFGGTKLGTGGLVRAYSETASKAIEASGIKEHYLVDRIKIETAFSFYNQILRAADSFFARQINSDFSDIVIVEYEVRKSLKEIYVSTIVEITDGKAKIEEA